MLIVPDLGAMRTFARVACATARAARAANIASSDPRIIIPETHPVETLQQLDREAADNVEGRRPIVALGAGEGGLPALQQFFRQVPSDSGMALIVILRLPPDGDRDLAALLAPQSAIPVTEVAESTSVETNHVYVVPPDQHVVMVDGTIRLSDRERPEDGVAPIDMLFRTLAETHGLDAAAVVLSGNGADGAMGIQRIKEMGGLTLAQDPADAEAGEMPQRAVATGMVDVVLPAAELPAKIVGYWRRAETVQLSAAASPEPLAEEDVLREIFALLRMRTGHDFSQYKRSTILRRLSRRMQVTYADTPLAYLTLLQGSLEETRALLRDFLISVTNFFRDREAWEALEAVVPRLFTAKTAGDQVRVWVTGCATGEEAYSVAILLHEHAARHDDPPSIQVFATDIDDDAITVARQGVYPETIAVDVEPARLRRYFTAEPGHYRVKQEIRDLVLFAPHNLLRDPPFSRLDLVTCRNVLIYLNRGVQEQILRLFHFALHPDGHLLLGTSESTDGVPDLFAPVDRGHRLFQRRTVPTSAPLLVAVLPMLERRQPTRTPAPPDVADGHLSFGALHQDLLLEHVPPSILVSTAYDVVHVSAGAGQFLQFGEGEPSRNLLDVAHPDLRLELRTALYAAGQHGGETVVRRLPVDIKGRRLIELVVSPIREPDWAHGFILIVLREIAEIEEIVQQDGSDIEPMVRQIEDELRRTKDQLRLTVEQYETAAKEHRAANEELQAINEEARATSEELETSKEELQSANEELTTLNQALKHSLEEARRANNDLQNLMAATEIGTIFLDRELRIMRYTPSAQALFNVLPADINRPLVHITHRLVYDELLRDAEHARVTREPVEREVSSHDGRWYLAQLLPYQTSDAGVTGVVLTFVDITERKHDELRLRERDEQLALAQRAGRVGFWSFDAVTGTGFVSEECRVLLGDMNATDNDSFEAWLVARAHPDDRARVDAIRQSGNQSMSEHDLEFRIEHPERGERWILVRSRILPAGNGENGRLLGVAVDVTERKHGEAERERLHAIEREARAAAEEAVRIRDQFLSVASHELRTPLTTLQGYANMLQRPGPARNDGGERSRRMVATIVLQSERLNTLIGQLLDASRLQRGQFELHRRPLDLAELVDRAVDEFRMTLPTDGPEPAHTVELSGADAAVLVLGDADRLHQVLQNLLSNAVKYSPDEGLVQVRVAMDATDASLEVEDRGIGIPAEARDNLFQPFYRAYLDDNRSPAGLGIGLYVVHEIVTRHGGRIEVTSVEGKGSTFRVVLPLHTETE